MWMSLKTNSFRLELWVKVTRHFANQCMNVCVQAVCMCVCAKYGNTLKHIEIPNNKFQQLFGILNFSFQNVNKTEKSFQYLLCNTLCKFCMNYVFSIFFQAVAIL